MELLNKTKKFNYILLFCLFFTVLVCDSSFVMVKQTSGTIRIIIDLIATCGIFILLKPKIARESLWFLLALITIPIIWMAFSGDIKQTVILCVSIFVGWGIYISFSKSLFLNMFNKTMIFLSVFSLVALIIYIFLPFVIKIFPIAHQNSYYISYNLIFSVITDTGDILRNYGIFWEPGSFAVFLCIALWAELFCLKTRVRNVVIYVITIITTFSTLGLIAGLLLLITYMFKNKHKNNSIKLMIGLFLLIGIIWVIFFGEEYIDDIFGKMIDKDESATTRWNSIILVSQLIFKAPIFGVGISAFLAFSEKFLSGMATNTLINLFAMHGVIGGIIPVFGSLNFFVKTKNSFLPKLLLFFFGILLFSSQAFEQISIFYSIVFYGLMLSINHKKTLY